MVPPAPYRFGVPVQVCAIPVGPCDTGSLERFLGGGGPYQRPATEARVMSFLEAQGPWDSWQSCMDPRAELGGGVLSTTAGEEMGWGETHREEMALSLVSFIAPLTGHQDKAVSHHTSARRKRATSTCPRGSVPQPCHSGAHPAHGRHLQILFTGLCPCH